jgi:hypothetical protein
MEKFKIKEGIKLKEKLHDERIKLIKTKIWLFFNFNVL